MRKQLEHMREEIEAMQETIEILQDPELMKTIRASMEAIQRGDTVSLEEARRALGPGMKCTVRIGTEALEQLKNIKDRSIRQELFDRIEKLANDPEQQGKPLRNELAGLRSVRAVRQRIVLFTRWNVKRLLSLSSPWDCARRETARIFTVKPHFSLNTQSEDELCLMNLA